MDMTPKEQAFLKRRQQLLRIWRITGPLLLLVLVIAAVLMFFNYPLMFNPYEAIERLEAGTLDLSTLQLMALMLPLAMLMLLAMPMVIVLMLFAILGNDKKYLAIIERIESERRGD